MKLFADAFLLRVLRTSPVFRPEMSRFTMFQRFFKGRPRPFPAASRSCFPPVVASKKEHLIIRYIPLPLSFLRKLHIVSSTCAVLSFFLSFLPFRLLFNADFSFRFFCSHRICSFAFCFGRFSFHLNFERVLSLSLFMFIFTVFHLLLFFPSLYRLLSLPTVYLMPLLFLCFFDFSVSPFTFSYVCSSLTSANFTLFPRCVYILLTMTFPFCFYYVSQLSRRYSFWITLFLILSTTMPSIFMCLAPLPPCSLCFSFVLSGIPSSVFLFTTGFFATSDFSKLCFFLLLPLLLYLSSELFQLLLRSFILFKSLSLFCYFNHKRSLGKYMK